jgi:hypothetical protein
MAEKPVLVEPETGQSVELIKMQPMNSTPS